jgi:hypothetical protein
VISYGFYNAEKNKRRSFNKLDLSNLESIFSGSQNKIKLISPHAVDIPKYLSSEGIMETFECGKYLII